MTESKALTAAFLASGITAAITAGAAFHMSSAGAPKTPVVQNDVFAQNIGRAQLIASFLTGAGTVHIGGRSLSIQSQELDSGCALVAAHDHSKAKGVLLRINPIAAINTEVCEKPVVKRVREATADPAP